MRRLFANMFSTATTTDSADHGLLVLEADTQRRAASLDAKRKEAIARLGERWLLHPKNHVRKISARLSTENQLI